MKSLSIVFFIAVLLCTNSAAQTTAFTYQGSLKDGVNAANGNYDFEFRFYEVPSGGVVIGGVQQLSSVAVANGIFTVTLDFPFGVSAITECFLDIRVRLAGQPTYTQLGPRQQIKSAPYAVKSLNTDNGNNVFLGRDAGIDNLTGFDNTFVGSSAGNANTSGWQNTYVGRLAGNNSNAAGSRNTLLGYLAGLAGGTIDNATAIGNRAVVGQSNSLVLGSINGINGSTQDTNVGIGTTTPSERLHVVGSSRLTGDVTLATLNSSAVTVGPSETTVNVAKVGIFNNSDFNVVLRNNGADIEGFLSITPNGTFAVGTATNNVFQIRTNGTNRINIEPTGEVGIGTVNPSSTLDVNGTIEVATLGSPGIVALCRNASNQIATCTASRGSDANIDELKGQIASQQKLNAQLQKQVEDLRTIVCSIKADAEICKTQEK